MRAVAACSSSGGKDSLLAMWRARAAGLELRTQLTMFDETGQRARSHGVSRALLQRQADALGLELVGRAASWASYEEVFIATLRQLRSNGHSSVVFGDIDLEAHRAWEERVCAAADLEPRLPLWKEDRAALAREVIARGFRAIVVCVDSRRLGDEFCGREYDASFIADLPPDVDACGENGEFHTFVFDGPLFRTPLAVHLTGREPWVAPAELGAVRYCFAQLAPG